MPDGSPNAAGPITVELAVRPNGQPLAGPPHAPGQLTRAVS